MGFEWKNTHRMQLISCFLISILILSQSLLCLSLNPEGLALLEFRAKVRFDPSGDLEQWDPNDSDSCLWVGVNCLDGHVVMLNLSGYDLEGTLSPDLGNLTHLKVLDLSKNQFSGTVPPQFGQLASLEVLDLTDNDLSGTVPETLGDLLSLQSLFLCGNRFEGSIPSQIRKLPLLNDLRFDEFLSPAAEGIVCVNRKFGLCIWQSVVRQSKKSESLLWTIQWSLYRYLNLIPQFAYAREYSTDHADESCNNLTDTLMIVDKQQVYNARRVLAEESSNLMANPPNISPSPSQSPASLPSRSSGSFPAVPKDKISSSPVSSSSPSPSTTGHANDRKASASEDDKSLFRLIIGITISIFLIFIIAIILLVFRSEAARTIGPWKSGLSGQLQKAFVTGVPKLNRAELETACEDFSNIISTHDGVATLYKGTLSSGVEISVVSTAITWLKDWSKRSELSYRKKIESLSRVNHKNFVNLIGYCEEDEPFTRMMVFEYAPNGSLSEHLHVKELEHLDWHARMRVIMGTAYCLQYMHDLNPPVFHSRLTSEEIFLTDDYAAKIADVGFWAELVAKSKNLGENESEHSENTKLGNAETNIHSFGILLLEIITGKLPYSEEEGHLIDSAMKYLNDKRSLKSLVDPTLKTFKEEELEIVCEVIRSCTEPEAHQRPSMKDVIHKLRQVIDISPEAATPRLSPLWWAELEILSAEAA